jgi:hypothetical protein
MSEINCNNCKNTKIVVGKGRGSKKRRRIKNEPTTKCIFGYEIGLGGQPGCCGEKFEPK